MTWVWPGVPGDAVAWLVATLKVEFTIGVIVATPALAWVQVNGPDLRRNIVALAVRRGLQGLELVLRKAVIRQRVVIERDGGRPEAGLAGGAGWGRGIHGRN